MNPIDLTGFYEQRIILFQNELSRFRRKSAGIVCIYWHVTLWLILIILIAAACFLYVVSLHANIEEKIRNLERLIQINRDEININNGDYFTREDGSQYAPHHHS
jgi:hypothetical protein